MGGSHRGSLTTLGHTRHVRGRGRGVMVAFKSIFTLESINSIKVVEFIPYEH